MSKKYPTKTEIETAKIRFEVACRTLKANELLWNDQWNKAPNPFVAIKVYCSAKERKRRKPFVDEWIAASEEYQALKPNQKQHD